MLSTLARFPTSLKTLALDAPYVVAPFSSPGFFSFSSFPFSSANTTPPPPEPFP